MENRAGQPVDENDVMFRAELEEAGIEVVVHEDVCGGEVKTHITGRLPGTDSNWVFNRLWYYWSARKENDSTPGLPVPIANKLHLGFGNVVRVDGHCGCPGPEYKNSEENIKNGCSKYPWLTFFDKEGKKLCSQDEYNQYDKKDKDDFVNQRIMKSLNEDYRIVPDIYETGVGHVQAYHIDTQDGLNALADATKEQ